MEGFLSQVSKKTVFQVVIEATIVGLLLIFFIHFTYYFKSMIPDMFGQKDIEVYFIAGFLFHMVFEFTGINLWYSKEYCKLL